MNKRNIYYLTIAVAGILFTFYFYSTQLNKSTFALEVDPTKDTTDISGTMYRIRLTNVGLKQLTGIVVDLGKNDIQNLSSLDSGQSYFFYPEPDTVVNTVKVTTQEGIHIQSDFRSPTKVFGLPGAGR
ncbi:MAG: hypothetical protein M3156_04095 [Thermoproteota archaeon]|jgi:hypothetical protein|nr:hypothetical protein [Thermoproteota archaeon]